jgi:hypothetical protein
MGGRSPPEGVVSSPFCDNFGSFVEFKRSARRFDKMVPKYDAIPRALEGSAALRAGNARFPFFPSLERPRRFEKMSGKK